MSRLCLCLGLFSFSISYAYENIALRKPAYQEYRYPELPEALTQASNAVDGFKSNLSVWGGQCVVSDNNKQTATWWVNLASILSIHHMRIYYRTGNVPWGSTNGFTPRFLGFSVYVSNTTDKSEGSLCFKDRNYTVNTIPSVINISCPIHGQYVIYYNERLSGTSFPNENYRYAFNELCEFEVYGCPIPGVYGTNCSMPCPDRNCRYCHIETGACQGCKPGYQGHRCELDCNDGKYGEVCGEECGSCADLSYCNHVNGTCLTGCEAGYKGNLCRQECDIGTYGDKCNETCGNCQDQTKCHRTNGTCMTGCIAGFKGAVCKTPCPDGLFGPGCVNKCNITCRGCNRFNGLCQNECLPGWRGNYCHIECDFGTYGDMCNETCGKCRDQTKCHHSNGTCLSGCSAGYEGALCKTSCLDGEFGPGCVNTCNHTCRGCNKTNGLCESGCLPGWKGIYCHEECENNLFGENCTKQCGNCVKSEQCHHINGKCINGCDRGYHGFNCTEDCDDNYFGENCQERCNETCIGCNRKTGACENGCRPGWKGIYCHEACDAGYYGKRCLQECSAFCKTSRDCHHVSGYCSYGCKRGWQGKDCLEVSKLLDSCTDKQSFYVALGLFCGSLLLNGFFVAYIIILRKSRRRGSKKFQPDLTTANLRVEENDKNGSGVNGEYQELGEIGKDNSPYEALP